MTDKSAPSNWTVLQGTLLIALLAFLAFFAAGLGWYAAVALARVLGL